MSSNANKREIGNVRVDYRYTDSHPTHSNKYLWKPLLSTLSEVSKGNESVFDIGCGNGATAGMLNCKGFSVTAIDSSETGIALAQTAYPQVKFANGSAYDNLADRFGQFDIVISLEVIEHCFYPKELVRSAFELTKPGGFAIISTPYHGYIKNLALALTNHFDFHWTVSWDGGHIKFFSIRTLSQMLEQGGFEIEKFFRVGRVPPIAKSMLAVARRPTQ